MNFNPEETRLLLLAPGVGNVTIQRLEQVGIHSLAQLRTTGVEQALLRVEQSLGCKAWARRRCRPLMQALHAAMEQRP